jgi:tetratricopeptide (TPR) repeat protein
MRRFALVLFVSLLVATPLHASDAQKPADPPDGTAGYLFLVARHFESTGKIDEAIASLQKAIAIVPDSAELRAELAGLYARQDRAAEALTAAEEALKRDPNNREANRILGTIMAVLADQKKPLRPGDDPSQYAPRAMAALEKARGDGNDLNLILMLGKLQLRAGQFDKASVTLRRIVEEQPQYTEGGMLLASAQEGAGRIDDAIVTLEGALQINPTYFRGLVKLTQLYEQQQRWTEAAGAYARAQTANPRADLLGGQAAALLNAGAAAEARTLLKEGIDKRAKPDAALLYLLAESERQLKNPEGAAATARQLRLTFPNDRRGPLMEAQLHEEAGRVAEAEKTLRELIAKDPLDSAALNFLGYMMADRGDRVPEAIELVQRALRLEPGNPSYLDSLGWAYLKQGNLAEADKPLTDAASQLPRNSVVQDHLGELRFRQERFADAAAAWERALAGDGESVDRAAIEKKLREARGRIKK